MSMLASPVRAEITKPFIISGFDDVLRQAENTSLTKAALKIFEKDETFAGMPELYQAIVGGEPSDSQLFLVSGISSWFQERIERFLTKSGYPHANLSLRNWLTEWSIENFKMTKIEKFLSLYQDRQFIVIFDNSSPSIVLSNRLLKQFPSRIAAIYLRQVVSQPPPDGVTAFITAFDIGLSEISRGRMDPEGLEKVATAIIEENNPEKIIPFYAYCPKDYDPCATVPADHQELCRRVRNKIIDVCKR